MFLAFDEKKDREMKKFACGARHLRTDKNACGQNVLHSKYIFYTCCGKSQQSFGAYCAHASFRAKCRAGATAAQHLKLTLVYIPRTRYQVLRIILGSSSSHGGTSICIHVHRYHRKKSCPLLDALSFCGRTAVVSRRGRGYRERSCSIARGRRHLGRWCCSGRLPVSRPTPFDPRLACDVLLPLLNCFPSLVACKPKITSIKAPPPRSGS